MRTLRQKVASFALVSRIFIIFLQAGANYVLPDHVATGVFLRPTTVTNMSSMDKAVDLLVGGLERWDAQYFLHIAEHGYVYENTVAFFPLFPMVVRTTAALLRFIFRELLNIRSLLLLSSVLVNIYCFVKSVDILYLLSTYVLKDDSLAYFASLLFCVNPASIFFSAPYSESLFSFLVFSGMYIILDENYSKFCPLPFGLASATRSNGILNIGFILFSNIKHLVLVECPLLVRREGLMNYIMLPFRFVRSFAYMIQLCILAFAPFCAFQIHCYQLFCSEVHLHLPEVIIEYGRRNGLVMPSTSSYWCNTSLPLAYSYVQEQYWNVGFLRYFEWKQVPNFLLAMPMIGLMLSQSIVYFKQHPDLVFSLGFKVKTKKFKQLRKEDIMSPDMFVFVVHAFLLTLFCLLFVHVQVTTRMICSSSPVPYWFGAYLLHREFPHGMKKDTKAKAVGMERVRKQVRKQYSNHGNGSKESDREFCSETVHYQNSYWGVITLTRKPKTLVGRIIVFYFICYAMIGTILFSNFYPWT